MTLIDHLRTTWDQLLGPGSPFELATADVLGRPTKVFAKAPASMRAVWEATAAAKRDGTYLVFEDEHLSYPQVAAQVRSLAHHLRDAHGVGPGDRVAIAMRNYPEWVVSYWAILCTGAAAVGLNAWWTTAEMEYGLGDSAPKVFIADAERVARVLPVLDRLRAARPLPIVAVRTTGDLPADAVRWEDVVRADTAPPDLPPADIHPDDDACIFYTSGTTGFPKGAQLTHRGCVTNLFHLLFWGATAGAALGRAAAEAGQPPAAAEAASTNVYLAATPLFHVTANNCVLHPVTMLGATLVLMYKWDPVRALELIEREKVTNFTGVPTMSRELLSHPAWAEHDTSSLVGMGGGGAALQPDLVEKIDKTLEKGAPSTGYGLTETTGIVTANGAAFFVAKPASCGPIMPTFDWKLVDEVGETLPKGATGRLCVRGPAVIKGYLNRPDATDQAIQDGWFDTGDVARVDEDGFLYIVDRAKDMVLRGGENVFCAEVETAIFSHPAVAEAAVFGVPDERLGEEVAAAVYLQPGASLTEDALRAHLAERIAAFKIPAKIWFLAEPLPRNANGKFVKRDLKQQLLGG